MSESDRRPPWSELLPDLLSVISNKLLDPVDLLAFRATCHNWQLASSNAAAKLKKSLSHQMPWLLCQESINKEECILHNFSTRGKYIIKLPELVGTNILGSFQGWILVFNFKFGLGQIFFFCPFTRHKIHLPNLRRQFPMRFDSTAVFSNNSSPTSILDHTICVITRENHVFLDIYILRPGAQAWDKVNAYCSIIMLEVVTGGALTKDGNLILFNYKDNRKVVMLNFENKMLDIIPRQGAVLIHPDKKGRTFIAMENYLESNDKVRKFLSMDDDQTLAPVYVWGTRFWRDRRGNEVILSNESNIEHIERMLCNKPLRCGIWLQPRLFEL